MGNPTYLSKTLAAASSTGIGTLSSASPGVATLNTSSFDTQRRVSIASASGTLASATFTITGTRQGTGTVTESITGPTSNVPVATLSDFLSVTSVSASSVINTQAIFGTNTQGSTPWQSVNLDLMLSTIGSALHFSSTTAGMVASIEITMDYPFLTSPQVPGGLPASLNAVPIPFIVSTFSSVSSDLWDIVNLSITPITAWRLLLTSSSTTPGSVNCTTVQSGIAG
jgi:hypothetical protein